MSRPDPHEWFPQFYANPAIGALAPACRWTISGRLGEDGADQGRKAPVDVRHMLAGCTPNCRHEGPLRGAFRLDSTCLMDLDELTAAVPLAANVAYRLQSSTDGVVVLDVEPDCPPEVSAALLAIPGALYSEVSMSGHGYHLLFPLPSNAAEFPDAADKAVLREEHGWYEVLLDHWVTFTRTPVPSSVVAAPSGGTPSTLDALYASLAALAKPSPLVSPAVLGTDGSPDLPMEDWIVEQTLEDARPRLKTPDAFGNDMSRWEFSTLGILSGSMHLPLVSARSLGNEYSGSDEAWLLYRAASQVLPHRPKHDTTRNGRPFLLDRAAGLLAMRAADL